VALLVLLPYVPARAQTSTTYFFPEFDAYFRLNSNVRLVFQAKEAIEGGDLNHAAIGPSIQFYLKPLIKLKKVTAFDMDEAKSRPLMLIIGYRYLPSPNAPTRKRMEPVAMFHFPIKGRILITDKNRADLDWSNRSFTWRYRNRITAERRFTIHSYHPGPYASAEFFYESQYAKWSITRLFAGCLLQLGKHIELDPYYQHDNNTEKHPNHQVNAVGLILNLYFPAAKV
jgi:hypothetical protein